MEHMRPMVSRREMLGRMVLPALAAAAVAGPPPQPRYRLVGKTKYLNNAHAIVCHSIDDSTKWVPNAVDAMDKYDIKATLFVSTEEDPAPEGWAFPQLQMPELWQRLGQAIENGHEIGSHSRNHPCKRPRPDSVPWCLETYTDYEIVGSRDDILHHTKQPYVWSWCYPCGHCATYDTIQKRIRAAGYIVARNYPDELHNGQIRPDLQTWDSNPMNAAYTQVVQKRGARTEVIDVDSLNAKFDEIYQRGGIYNFMSHPQWLDYGPDGFYERHLSHVARRSDVWYVPMGPLYAYRTIHDETEVRELAPGGAKARFELSNKLDSKIYNGSITLEFAAPAGGTILSNGKKLAELEAGAMADRWDREYFRRDGEQLYVTAKSKTILEFR